MTLLSDAALAPVQCPVLSWMAAPTNVELCTVCACHQHPGSQIFLWAKSEAYEAALHWAHVQ